MNFKKANFRGMNRYFADLNFEEIFQDKPIEEKVTIFHEVLNEGINRFIPTYEKKIVQKCPWTNKRLQSLKNKKDKEWKRFRKSGVRQPYDEAFKLFDSLNTELYDRYVNKMQSSLKTVPSSFWRYVNSKKNTSHQPKSLQYGDKRSTSETKQANFFANFFQTNYLPVPRANSNTNSSSINAQDQINECFQLDHGLIANELASINVKKSAGPDGIHPMILKRCAHSLIAPLTHIFNESLAMGFFPQKWKRSAVSPIFKKGSRSNVENYRCIAKLPTIAKFFEHLVNTQLLQLVQNKITNKQHGFMKHRSTASNLSEFVHYAYNGLNN